MKVGDFWIQLGVKADIASVKDFVHSIGELPLEAAGALLAIGAIEYKLTELAKLAVNTSVGFELFTNQTGLSAQELQRWQIVAEQANVSAESVASTVTNLQKKMAEARLTGSGANTFLMLGVSPYQKDAFAVLTRLRETIKHLNRPMAMNLMGQLGISPEMVNLLLLSNREFKHMSHSVRGMTEEQQSLFLETKRSLVELGQQIRYFGFDVLQRMIVDFQSFHEVLKEIPIWMPGIIAAVTALGLAFAPTITALTLLLLLLDDLAVYFQGGDSLIGRVAKGLGVDSPIKMMDALKQLSSKNPASQGIGWSEAKNLPWFGNNSFDKSVQKIINITVNGAGKAEDVAKEVIREVERYFSQSELQGNNGGR